jgi:hypothetical protein
MKRNPSRILYINGGLLNRGGIESFMMNYYRHFDHSILQIDFVVYGNHEALMCGLPVIAIENCGSSILLNDIRGRVFSVEKNNLEEVLLNFVPLLPYSIEKWIEIRNWALQNISGEAAAKSFEEIIEYIFDGKCENPVAPWLKN